MNITSKTIKEGLKNNGYTPQKLGFDNRRPFNMGLHSQSEEKTDDSPFKMTESPLKQTEYWYKVNGKTTTKAAYNAYENKPGSDEPGKSTNDPDASGNKAKIADDRANNKASKRPTVLTKEQTKLKNQGTKLPEKKPPFNYQKTPLDFKSPVKQVRTDSTTTFNKDTLNVDSTPVGHNLGTKSAGFGWKAAIKAGNTSSSMTKDMQDKHATNLVYNSNLQKSRNSKMGKGGNRMIMPHGV